MTNFEQILTRATKSIDEKYFTTKIASKNNKIISVYRERIYCYELYHQIRSIWPNEPTIEFHAEYDKTGSSLYAKTSSKDVKPDFLIHTPGTMDNNFIAMEVKSSNARRADLKKDIDKLIRLTNEQGFRFGIYLIYGKKSKEKGEIIRSYSNDKIKIYTHIESGFEAELLGK